MQNANDRQQGNKTKQNVGRNYAVVKGGRQVVYGYQERGKDILGQGTNLAKAVSPKVWSAFHRQYKNECRL